MQQLINVYNTKYTRTVHEVRVHVICCGVVSWAVLVLPI